MPPGKAYRSAANVLQPRREVLCKRSFSEAHDDATDDKVKALQIKIAAMEKQEEKNLKAMRGLYHTVMKYAEQGFKAPSISDPSSSDDEDSSSAAAEAVIAEIEVIELDQTDPAVQSADEAVPALEAVAAVVPA